MSAHYHRFEILGPPVGEGRPRAVRAGALGVRMHAAPRSAEWRALAARQMRDEMGASGPVDVDLPLVVTIEAVMPRPKSLPKKAGTGRVFRSCKPDVDNLAKSSLDALVQGGVITDDRQVAVLVVRKMTAALGELPRTIIEVTRTIVEAMTA